MKRFLILVIGIPILITLIVLDYVFDLKLDKI